MEVDFAIRHLQGPPQLIERKGQVDTDAQETSRASNLCIVPFKN